MQLRHAHFPTLLATLLIACGGSVFKNDDDGGGARGSGGSASAGKSSGGASSRAGSGSVGGGSSGGGVSGGGLGGGPNCAAVDCAAVDCSDGYVSVLEPGACCPTCQPKLGGCENVTCEPVKNDCGPGYALTQPAGACCAGCFPTGSGTACTDIACLDPKCPLGYVPGETYGGCCYDCVPDPLFCETPNDCVLADKPRSCCGCPESITRRQYQAEPCWSASSEPRMIPQSCYPQAICDAVCGPCEDDIAATCIDHRCTTRSFSLK